MRHASRIDANQPEIVEALRAIGASVQLLHTVGGGVPDLLVGHRGRDYKIEVKDGSKSPSDRKLTPDQVLWHQAWQGSPVYVVTCVDEAIRAVSLTC